MATVEEKGLSEEQKKKRAELLEAVVEDAIEISDRFSPEPVFGPTGKGYLKSEGVGELKKLKEDCEDR